jgi:hypothetical protein
MPAGETLHEFDLDLCRHARANIRHHANGESFRRALQRKLSAPLAAYVLAPERLDDNDPWPLFTTSDFAALEEFAQDRFHTERTEWVPDEPLHRRYLDAVPEIRAHIAAATAEEWATTSCRLREALETKDLALHEGLTAVDQWVRTARRLLGAMDARWYLPRPEGSWPTPELPAPPPPAPSSKEPSSQQVRGDQEDLMAAVREVRDLLVTQRTVKDWYSTEELAQLLNKADFTVREWCRAGRILAEKRGAAAGSTARGSSPTTNFCATSVRASYPSNTERIACCCVEGRRCR